MPAFNTPSSAITILSIYGQVRHRAFGDYAVCQANLATSLQCWQLWQQRQQLTGDDVDVDRAKLAINSHLERIEQYRPLATVTDLID